MKFSLIVATFGRSIELDRLFASLASQSYRDFEVIVVDQNEDDRVRRIVDRFSEQMTILYRRSPKGLSRARNVGLRDVQGDIVAFPDDDCWYAPDVLSFVAGRLKSDSSLDGLTGCSVDGDGRLSQGRWSADTHLVNRYNIWTSATSYTIFLRSAAVRTVGEFDEKLGVGSGSRWGAGEEVNFLLSAMRAGATVRYDPALRVSHPEPLQKFDDKAFARGRLYNRGFGRVLGINRYPWHFVLYSLSRPMVGCLLSLLKGDIARSRYYWIATSQRMLGWSDRG
ncbi:glycosyltransferase family 2 protein [Paraburkholderia sp. BCC1886]|uniref:glycosyltransferase family 2 protein n=1 Tax=Paraburkholderia sp. BCC1886 TaxID=2562670 RepID=UPI00118323E6|nr:glycosyltransferase family 2 protein [Paraburkholderia sp. BCC1886]